MHWLEIAASGWGYLSSGWDYLSSLTAKYQTLIATGVAIYAARMAANPVWKQLEATHVQNSVAVRNYLASQAGRIEAHLSKVTQWNAEFFERLSRAIYILRFNPSDENPEHRVTNFIIWHTEELLKIAEIMADDVPKNIADALAAYRRSVFSLSNAIVENERIDWTKAHDEPVFIDEEAIRDMARDLNKRQNEIRLSGDTDVTYAFREVLNDIRIRIVRLDARLLEFEQIAGDSKPARLRQFARRLSHKPE